MVLRMAERSGEMENYTADVWAPGLVYVCMHELA